MEGYDSDNYLYDEDDEIHEEDAAPPAPAPTCHWRLFDDEMNAWQGACCERAFMFEDGTPVENGFTHCPYCGKALILAV